MIIIIKLFLLSFYLYLNLKIETMKNLILPLYSWGNGAFIMIIVFGLVILGLIGAVMLMMNSDKKKKENDL
jgi:hypothetical protein